jgi:hypothetical protein
LGFSPPNFGKIVLIGKSRFFVQIEIGRGLGKIVFGMTEKEIYQILGKPDKTYTEADEYGEETNLQYFQQKVVLKIEHDNDQRLGWIEVHNKNIHFPWCNPWVLDREELLLNLEEMLGEKYILEDYGHMECCFFQENWVELQFCLGELTCINLGVFYGDNDVTLWPTL